MKALFKKGDLIKDHSLYLYVIKIDDVKSESNRILNKLKERTWLSEIEDETLVNSFRSRADKTSSLFETKMNEKSDDFDDFLTFIGEKIITINSNETIEDEKDFKALPLPELFKMKAEGNPGFDFFNEDKKKCFLIYGEGKFIKGKTAYNNAAKQVCSFLKEDYVNQEWAELMHFANPKSGSNPYKEFSIGFSFPKGMKYDDIFNNLKSNKYVNELLTKYTVYAIGVEI